MCPRRLLATGFLLAILLPLAQGMVPFSRAMYGNWNYTLLAELGFDAVYENKLWHLGPQKALMDFARESLEAREHNLTYVCGLYYLMGAVPFDDYVRAVTESGAVLERTPSPVDETYWRRTIEEPALAIANLSLHYPIWGIAWDFELYGGEDFDGWDYSYDEPGLVAFANSSNVTMPILDPEERYAWLVDNDLLQAYKDWLRGRAYTLARATREKVDAINPNLSLGILAFASSWFYWSILDAFETPQAPITAWCEDTYRGYDRDRVEGYHSRFAEHGVEGLFLPGFYTGWIGPWGVIEWMEAAVRHNGAFWAYQFDASSFKLAPEAGYMRACELFEEYFLLHREMAPVRPSFRLYPFVEARPYGGPDNITVMLLAGPASSQIADRIELLSDSPGLIYVGENLSRAGLSGSTIGLGDLPCFVSGISQRDLARTEAWGLMTELAELLGYCDQIGIAPGGSLGSQLSDSTTDYEAGRYDLSAGRLRLVVPEAYAQVMDSVRPLVQEGLSNPRQSRIPLACLTRLSTAGRLISEGSLEEGAVMMLRAMRDWALEVYEPRYASLFLIGLAASMSLLGRRGVDELAPRGETAHARLQVQGDLGWEP